MKGYSSSVENINDVCLPFLKGRQCYIKIMRLIKMLKLLLVFAVG